jgi:hypothetical protein
MLERSDSNPIFELWLIVSTEMMMIDGGERKEKDKKNDASKCHLLGTFQYFLRPTYTLL